MVGVGVELVERNDCRCNGGAAEEAGEAVGDVAGAGLGAVGDEERGGTVLDEVSGGEFRHFSCADDEDLLAAEGAEDLASEVDGDRGDGDGGGADLGFGADALGDGEGFLEQGVEG